MRPVLDLLKQDSVVEWRYEHTKAVNEVMDVLKEQCFLKLPSYDRPFHVVTDYSSYGIGASLMQYDDAGNLLPL